MHSLGSCCILRYSLCCKEMLDHPPTILNHHSCSLEDRRQQCCFQNFVTPADIYSIWITLQEDLTEDFFAESENHVWRENQSLSRSQWGHRECSWDTSKSFQGQHSSHQLMDSTKQFLCWFSPPTFHKPNGCYLRDTFFWVLGKGLSSGLYWNHRGEWKTNICLHWRLWVWTLE